MIVDADGKPVGGAVVQPGGWDESQLAASYHVYGSPPFVDVAAITDPAGKFVLISDRPVKAIDLEIAAERLGRHTFKSVPTGLEENRLQLKRGSSVTGRVVSDGQGVGGVKVAMAQVDRASATFVGPLEATTDADGRFSIAALLPAEEMVVFGVMDSFRDHGALRARTFTSADQGVFDLGDLPLDKGYRVSGRIVLSDGKPVPVGMRVMLGRPDAWDDQTVLTDTEGKFVVSGVPAEIVTVSVALRDYAPGPQNKSYDPSEHHHAIEGRIAGDIDDLIILCERNLRRPADLSPDGQLAFAKYRRTRTEPLAGVTEKLETPVGERVVTLHSDQPNLSSGWSLPVPKVAVRAARPAPPAADAQPAKTIVGTVTDIDGKPVAGAGVWLPAEWNGRLARLAATAQLTTRGIISFPSPKPGYRQSDRDARGRFGRMLLVTCCAPPMRRCSWGASRMHHATSRCWRRPRVQSS